MKGQVGNGTRNRWLHFGGVPDDRLDPGIFWRILHRCEMRKRLAEVGTLRVLFYRPVWLQTCPLQRSFHVQSGILALKLNTTEECSGSRPLSTRLMISCSYRFKKKQKKHHSEDTDLPGGVSRGANSYPATYLVKNELTVFSHHWIIHSPGLRGQHGSVCWHSGGMGITKLPIAAKKADYSLN